uniref:Transcriptional repressor n=1 Tax=Ammonifex degensii TaxID=42838 RepID=A0A7C1FD71_9THEO
MSREIESFRTFLSHRGGRLTNERKAVLEAIFSFHHHFTAEELLDQIKSRGDKVSRASVYRALELLVAANLLQKLDLGENRNYYEQHFEPHHHLICVSCNRVIEFSAEPMEALERELWKRYHFTAKGFPQKILGRCRECTPYQPEGGSQTR